MSEKKLERVAEEALAGVGDPNLGEWREWTGKAFHIRRRLTLDEQSAIGPAVDIRGTPEALERIQRVHVAMPMLPLEWLMEEH